MSLKKIRLGVALAFLCVFTGLYFADRHDWIPLRKAFLSSQIPTALTWLGPKLVIVLIILALTALFGRWYCSLLCPAGHVQDLFTRIGRRLGLARLGHTDSPRPANMLVIFAILGITGFLWLLSLIDPVGLFGRAMQPAGETARYYLDDSDSLLVHGPALVVAVLFGTAFLAIIPIFFGRIFCDRVCPVGALLKVASMGSGRRMQIAATDCVSCGKCEKTCPAHCIDAKAKSIDAQRCLLCMDCVGVCPTDGLRYAPWKPKERRKFLDSAAALACGGFYIASREIRGRLQRPRDADSPVIPPGVEDSRRYERCVTCQACVLACPVRIIRPGVDSRPVLDYDLGYCQYNCRMCAHSCPAGVFKNITLEEKHTTRIARTHYHSNRCVVITQGTACGACAEVCPTHAVTMREQEGGKPTIPDFDVGYCIGCGACYHVCPSEPRAFTIQGLSRQERSQGVRPTSHAAPAGETPEWPAEGELQDFPF